MGIPSSGGKAAPGPVVVNPNPETLRVRAAIAATRAQLVEHWRGLVESRTLGHPSATGSVTDHKTVASLEAELDVVSWHPYSHPAVRPGCTAFWTPDLRGVLGVVSIAELPVDVMLTLRDGHATGTVSAEVEGTYGATTDGTCLIVGDHNGMEVVFTFHPGEPVTPSSVPASGFAGRSVTRDEALSLGFSLAKVRRPACDGCVVCTTGGCLCDTPEEHADALAK